MANSAIPTHEPAAEGTRSRERDTHATEPEVRSTGRISDDRRIDDRAPRYTENRLTENPAPETDREFHDPEPEKRRAIDDRRLDEPSAPVNTTLESDLSSEARIQQHADPLDEEGRRKQLRVGMPVIGRDGKHIGTVKEVRQTDFHINRELARDVYVPFSAVLSVGEHVMLSIEAAEAGDQGWDRP